MLPLDLLKSVVVAPLTLTEQWLGAWSQYLGGMPTPGQFVTDCVKFWATLCAQQRPQFAHPNVVVGRWSIAKLRDFSTEEARYPTLVVAPRSGMSSAGVDLDMQSSLIGTLLAAGHHGTHCLDWVPATTETAAAGISEHVEVIQEAIDLLGGRVHLVGFSQGGWMAAIVSALCPETVVTVTLGAAPIDFHAGLDRPTITGYRALSKVGDLTEPVEESRWVYPGILQAGLLRTMEWSEDSAHAAATWAEIGNTIQWQQNAAIRQWLNAPEDLPGPFVRWMINELFAANKLIRTDLMIGGQRVDLSKIECPLYLIAGAQDVICPAAQVWALSEAVSTSPHEICQVEAPAGHVGLLFDPKVLADYWSPMLSASATVA